MNDLQKLSDAATQGKWGRFSTTNGPFREEAKANRDNGGKFHRDSSHEISALQDGKPYRIGSFTHADAAAYVETLVNAHRSGGLVTRADMEAAVKAEREACASIVKHVGGGGLYAAYVRIRARGDAQ